MQLDLTPDQELFVETSTRFILAELPLTTTRELHDHPDGFERSWMQRAAELGWYAALVPEDLGGGSVSGDGIADACLVAELHGRHGQPGPFIPMNVVAATVAAHGDPELQAAVLPDLIGAQRVATWSAVDRAGVADHGRGLVAAIRGKDVVLSGRRGFVQDGAAADLVLVSATLDGEPVQALVDTSLPGVRMEPLGSLDLARRFAHVHLDDVAVPSAWVVRGDGLGELQARVAGALNVADTVGAMEALFGMTLDYAKDRTAFGRPIGSFQAIKHLLADQALYLETAKAGADALVRAIAADAADATEVLHMVAAYVCDQGNELAQECLQVHGGIGFTWEHDLHLLMRRIRTNSALYGDAAWHREQLCRFHQLAVAP